MLSERTARALNGGTSWGVIGLAVAGFAMSYDALHALAVEQGVFAPLAWLWPLVVDGFIVVASLSVVRAVADGRRATYPWLLVLAFSGISVAFNVVHAAPTLVARLVAAIPPAALVLSFELLMRQVRAALGTAPHAARAARAPVPVRRPDQAVLEPRPPAALAAASPTSESPLVDRARQICVAARDSGRRVTGAVVARELGISDGYGRRLLRHLAADPGSAA